MIQTCPKCHSQNRVPARRLTERARCGNCKTAISPPNNPVPIGSDADFQELVTDSPLPVLVDFWAAWCGPCRMVAPELQKLASQYAGRLVIAKVDTEALPELGARFGIQSIPTLVLFRDAAEAHRVSGAMQAAGIAKAFGLTR